MKSHTLTLPTAADPLEQTRKPLPRLGFVGVGWIGRKRLQALAASGMAEMVAIADPSAENAVAARELAPNAHLCCSLQELLQMELDAVVIATPNACHAEQAVTALQAGLPVFCQKPLGRTAAETRLVIGAAREADCLLGVDFSYRFTSGFRAILALLREGALGKIFAIETSFHNAYGPDRPWFYNPLLSGGGCVLDLATHLVDLALVARNHPRVEKVSSRLLTRGEPLRDRTMQTEDYARARIDLADDTLLDLACSWKLHAGCDVKFEFAIHGTQGGAVLRNVNGSYYEFEAEHCTATRRRVIHSGPEEWEGRAALNWLQQLSGSRQFDPAIQQVTQTAEIIDAIYEL